MINLQSGNALAVQRWLGSADSFELPFVWHDGHIIIEVAVNHARSLRFAFDSAAAATVLFDTTKTKSIPLDIERKLDLRGRQVNVVNNGLIQVGEIELSDLTFIQVPIGQNPLFSDYDSAYFDGVIGYDLLQHFNTTIRFAGQTIVFSNRASAARSSQTFSTKQWTKLPLAVRGRIPYVDAEIRNTSGVASTYAFVVDTGAPDYLYLNEQLMPGFKFPDEYFETPIENFEGKQRLKTSRINFFALGNTAFQDLAAHDAAHFEDAHGVGLIGSGLLRNFDVHFNYQQGYLALSKNKQFSDKSAIDRSGLVVAPHQMGGLIKQVAADSDAALLGITSNMILTKINGEPLTESNFDPLCAWLNSTRSSVNLCWQAHGVTKCGDVKLKDRIPF